jgi:gliding motility-associated-like protein
LLHESATILTTPNLIVMNNNYFLKLKNLLYFKCAKAFGLLLVISFLLFSGNLKAANYYWVGGSGDWSDINHWVTTSGGSVNYTLVPTAYDDVHFDANSFTGSNQTVTLNAANYVCHNMTWSGVQFNPTFYSIGNYEFRIYGSLILTPAMNFNINGVMKFVATTSNNSIDMAGHPFKNSIYFDGSGGSWKLLSELNAASFTIYFIEGELVTQNNTIRCNSFYSLYTNQRRIDLGASRLYIGSGWSMDASNLTFEPGISSIFLLSSTASMYNTGTNMYNPVFNVNNSTTSVNNSGASLNNADSLFHYYNVSFIDTNGMVFLNSSLNNPVSFNVVNFNCNGRIFGDYTFNKLFLMNKYYELRENDTITINQSLITTGNCSSSVMLHSNNDSVLSYINKAGGVLNVDYVLLQDIAAVGTAVFTATNSIDLGNNPGWTIISPAPKNLYWVGGSGYWDDPAHWSLSSGGLGGTCVPTPLDNVFFDAFSFNAINQTVTLNGYNSYCNNIDWSGALHNPKLKGLFPNSLNVYGSLKFIAAMNNAFSGYIYFKAQSPGKTITSGGLSYKNNVIFKGESGGWSLTDEFNVGSNVIYFVKGFLNSNNQTISCANFISSYIYHRGLTLGSSTVNICGISPYSWNFCNIHLFFDAGKSTINLTGSYGGMNNVSGDTMTFYNVNFIHPAGCASLTSSSITSKFNRVVFLNNGSINGNNVYDTLNLNNSFYKLGSNKKQTIKRLITNSGNCSVSTFIFSSIDGTPAVIYQNTGTVNLNFLLLKDISASGAAQFLANHSVDMGNNSGWVFTSPAPHDLYWVGGSGIWNDPGHWSYLSGGPGGACVPNPYDNVFFDSSSFDAPNQTVLINNFYAFCHNMTWMDIHYSPTFSGMGSSTLMIYGSLTLHPLMVNNFEGSIYFNSTQAGNTIRSAGQIFKGNIYFNGNNGDWELEDDFASIKSVNLVRGHLNTASMNFTCLTFVSILTETRSLSLGSSDVFITEGDYCAWYFSAVNLSLDAGSSTIHLLSPNGGMTNGGPGNLEFHNVIFSDSSGCSELLNNANIQCIFNKVFFRSNGKIWGVNTFDTLTFYPAKTYTLQSGITQTIIKKLDMCGNGCFPITLKSSIPGTSSTIFKASGIVSAAFVEMRDQKAVGGANFYAGNYSVDISGNSGWIFGSGPGYVFGLPDSAFICPGDTLDISTYNFIGGILFEWQDGTIGPLYPAAQPGVYYVHVTYADHCSLVDTMNLFFSLQPFAYAGSDTIVCPSSQLWLSANGTLGSSFLWSTGDTNAAILVNPISTTTYNVSITNSCGLATDDVTVSTFPLPTAFAGNDTSICPGNSAILLAQGLPGSSFLWSNNQNTSITWVSPQATTLYTVTVTDQHNCGTATDDVMVSIFPSATADAGPDVTICSGTTTDLNGIGIHGSNFFWSNGETQPSINVGPLVNTMYTLIVTDPQQCGAAYDTVNVFVVNLPSVNAGTDTSICPGNPAFLTASGLEINEIVWGTGDTTLSIRVEPAYTQLYIVTVSNSCGTASDNVIVNVLPLPQINSIINDESCNRADGSILVQGGISYVWSTGDTTAYLSNLQAGTYTVTVSNGMCTNSTSVLLNMIPGPKAAFTVNTDFQYTGQNNFIFTDASENATGWNWDFGDNTTVADVQSVSHKYNATGTYPVTLIVSDENACTDTAIMNVTLEFPDLFYMPNAFTPNDDGLNETYGPIWRLEDRIYDFHMIIYDRWGEEVFSTSDQNEQWNGKFAKGNKVSADGIFTWIIQLTEKPGLEQQYTGQVCLLK